MTKEELEKENADWFWGASPSEKRAIEQAYLAGLKEGRPQWHDLRKDQNDLPLNTAPVLCLGSTGYIVCKYIGGSWIDNQTIELVPKYIDIYKWYEIEDTEE